MMLGNGCLPASPKIDTLGDALASNFSTAGLKTIIYNETVYIHWGGDFLITSHKLFKNISQFPYFPEISQPCPPYSLLAHFHHLSGRSHSHLHGQMSSRYKACFLLICRIILSTQVRCLLLSLDSGARGLAPVFFFAPAPWETSGLARSPSGFRVSWVSHPRLMMVIKL